MLTVHFNGDIVSSADMKKLAEERAINTRQSGRCVYGREEIKCDTWLSECNKRQEVKRISEFGRCSLQKCDKCPLYRMRQEAGNRIKKYKITSGDYRKMASGSHWLIKTNRNRVVFFTLTFPPTIKKHKLTKSFYLDEISNEFFSRFIENLKKTYQCTGYIAVKEQGSKNGRTHFHVIACFPRVDLRLLSDYWCEVIKSVCQYSNNALQTDKRNRIISNKGIRADRAIRYICKYFSKAKRENGSSYTRLVFISHNLLHKTERIKDIQASEILKGYKGIYIQTLEYVTVLRVTDAKSFNDLCEQFIYELFSDRIMTEIQQNSA